MSDNIIKILDNLGEKFGLAIDWSSQNIIPYVQDLMVRYVNRCNAGAITWIVLSVTIIILCVIGLVKLIKWANSEEFGDDSDAGDFLASMAVILIIAIVVLLIVILSNLFGLYQNIFTPELVFLEYIKKLCGGM